MATSVGGTEEAVNPSVTQGFTAHSAGPTHHPELQSSDPSAPGSGLSLGSLPDGGSQWHPAPDGSGGIRYRVSGSEAWAHWSLAWLHYLLGGARLLASSPGRWLTGFSV